MSEKNDILRYESEVIALLPLKMVLGDIPSPNPEGWRRKPLQKPGLEMKDIVNRLIVHLKKGER